MRILIKNSNSNCPIASINFNCKRTTITNTIYYTTTIIYLSTINTHLGINCLLHKMYLTLHINVHHSETVTFQFIQNSEWSTYKTYITHISEFESFSVDLPIQHSRSSMKNRSIRIFHNDDNKGYIFGNEWS